MKIVSEVRAWDEYTTYSRPQAWGRSGLIQVNGLVYVVGTDMPDWKRTKRTEDNHVGILAPIHGNNRMAESVQVEIRPHELRHFCEQFLQEYEILAPNHGWENLS